MTLRLTKALAADGWYKNQKHVSKKATNGGFVNMDKNHYHGQETPRFYLSFTDTSTGYLRTSGKGDYPTLDEAWAAGNALALGESIAA